MTTMAHVKLLKEQMGEILDLRAAIALLQWDQEVNMPPKAAEARGRQLATLSALAHERFTSAAFRHTLDHAEDAVDKGNEDEKRLVEETRYDFDKATKLPTEFVERLAGQERVVHPERGMGGSWLSRRDYARALQRE